MEQKIYQLEKLTDLVQFDDEQLDRVLADLKIWLTLRREAAPMVKLFGMQMQPVMRWIDDGETGISRLDVSLRFPREKP